MILKRIRPEVFILILLVICILISTTRFNGQPRQAAVIIDSNGKVSIISTSAEMAECRRSGMTVFVYNPEACRMIEVYDSNFNQVFSVAFNHDIKFREHMTSNSAIRATFAMQESGSRKVVYDEQSYDIDFSWVSVGERRYLISYVSSTKVKSHSTFFMIVNYMTLILVLTLFTNTVYWNSKDLGRKSKHRLM